MYLLANIQEDVRGLFIRAGDHVFRPGDATGISHAHDMSAAGLHAGLPVKVRHPGGADLCTIQLADGSERQWSRNLGVK